MIHTQTTETMKTTKISKSIPTVSAVYQVTINNRTFITFKRGSDDTWTVYENTNGYDLNDLGKMDWCDMPYRMNTKKKALETIKYCFG